MKVPRSPAWTLIDETCDGTIDKCATPTRVRLTASDKAFKWLATLVEAGRIGRVCGVLA
jgi:hypothetical protein